MNWLFALPLEARLAIVFVLGVLIGTQVNHGVYRLAWHRKSIGPWLPRDDKAPPRRWYDYLPIFGWFALRREANLHGAGFWLRPMAIELLMGVGLALLYWWEVEPPEGLTPQTIAPNGWGVSAPPPLPLQGMWATHAQFLVHTVLIALMAVATFIDIDEKTIPEEITDAGALVGLLLITLLPMGRLPQWNAFGNPEPPPNWDGSMYLNLTSPNAWPPWLDESGGLAIGLACFFGWWLAIVPWEAIRRRRSALAGVRIALTNFRLSLTRRRRPRIYYYRFLLAIALLGGVGVVSVWLLRTNIGLDRWTALLSSLVGMAAGGAIVWAVRIIGTRALGQEAMGFGDVTLVAMIGAFLGWQPCLMLFFIAPFIGVIIALAQLILTRRTEIWYGPFLCAGALLTIVFWAMLWEVYGRPLFGKGWLVPAILAILLVMMGAMLTIWRFIKERFIFRDDENVK